MIQPCPNRISCPGTDSPIANLSSETVEAAYWRAIGFCCDGTVKEYLSTVSADDAAMGLQRTLVSECGECPADPNVIYKATRVCADGTGTVTAYSTTSQEDADAQADAAAETCTNPDFPGSDTPGGGDDTPGGGSTIYANTAQQCSPYCPDGSTYTYVLPAGMIYGLSQAEANATAAAWACYLAWKHKLCLSALTITKCCADSAYTGTIKSTPVKRLNWQLYGGSLPTGVSFTSGWNNSGRITLTGTPTTPGAYSFSIIASDALGGYMVKAYTLCVTGMTVSPAGDTPGEFPDATQGTAYTATLSAPTCATAPLSWQVTSGALPAGLSLDEETGVISGTPSASGDFTFTVTLQTEAS